MQQSSELPFIQGDEWINIYQLEEGNVLSLFIKISNAAILSYGFKEGDK